MSPSRRQRAMLDGLDALQLTVGALGTLLRLQPGVLEGPTEPTDVFLLGGGGGVVAPPAAAAAAAWMWAPPRRLAAC